MDWITLQKVNKIMFYIAGISILLEVQVYINSWKGVKCKPLKSILRIGYCALSELTF